MSSQNFIIKKGLTIDTTEVIDENAELTTEAFGTEAEEKIQDVVGSMLTTGNGLTGTYNDATATFTFTVGAGTGITSTANDISVNFAAFDTDDLGEGASNLYYTDSRFNTAFNAKTTDNLTEGSNNLYYTEERVQDLVGGQFVTNGSHTGISFTYDDDGDGAIDATVSLSSFTTDDLAEGATNLYISDERIDDRVNDLLHAGDNISLTYDDVANTLTISTDADITGITAGNGISGGGTTGDITVNADVDDSSIEIDGDDKISVKALGITNSHLAGSIENGKLTNSSITINGTATSLGSSITLDTDDIGEGTSLYHTTERVQDVVGDQLVTNGTHTGISFSYDDAGDGAIDATVSLSGFDTDDVSEGSNNLYYTDERVDDRVNTLLVGGQVLETTYDDTNNVLTLDHSDVTRTNTSDTPAQLNAEDTFTSITSVTSSSKGHITGVETTTYQLPPSAVPNNATITISGGTDLETGGDFTTDQGTNETITLNHSAVSRSNTTDTPAQMAAQDTFEAITSVTTSAQGHVTGVETTTYQLPPSAVPNDATITISAGTNLTTGGDFTTDQGTNETITIDMDSDIDVTSVTADYIDMETGITEPSHAEGRMWWSDEYHTLNIFNDISDVTLQVGLEEWVRVYNNTGSSIPDGTPVYVTGASGETPTVAPGDATTETKARILGLTTHTIANNTSGLVTTRGLVSGLDTSSLTAGQTVHISPSGGLQTAAPTYPYFPTDLGICIVSDASSGFIYVNIVDHTFEAVRVTGNTHMDGNLTVEGNLNVNGTQTISNQANLAITDASIYLNSGDTIGEANTTFSGTGLDDAYFNNHYEGTTTTTYYVRIDSAGGGTGGVDTFEWSKDNFTTTEATGVDLADNVDLDNNICIHFNATTGHTVGDTWSGTAAPVNVDTGWASNRNTGTTGVGYTHMGVFFDVSDEKFKFYEEYDPEPDGEINTGHASFNLGTVVADTFEGAFTGDLTGTASNATTAVSLTGLTSTIAELNKLDGFTGTFADLNYAKDLRATGVTSAEFDHLDGVTSNIQTQLDGKMASTATLDTVADNGSTTNQTLTVGGISTTGNISGNQITTSYTSNSNGVVRNTYQSTSAPTSGDGQVGDVWIVYS